MIDGNSSNVDNDNEIRPYGEAGFFINTDTNDDKIELLMFDGVRTHVKSKVLGNGIFYGSNADSGDGAGLDTIKLIPDVQLFRNGGDFGNDQYIILDPTAPNHIHIRAGGTIDDSAADLFLGGELNHVRVSDGSDSVVIRADSGDSIPHTWTFNAVGDIIFPDTTVQNTAWSGGRVVSTPSTSLGAEGDIAGDLSFDGGYFYYCTDNYSGTPIAIAWSNLIEVSGEDHYLQADITDPSLLNGTLTVTNISVNGASPTTESVTSYELVSGNTYKFYLDNSEPWQSFQNSQLQTAPNIWRRVAWSNDTW